MMFKFWKKDSASEAYFEKFQSILTRMEAAMSDSVHSGSISCLILVQFLPYQQGPWKRLKTCCCIRKRKGCGGLRLKLSQSKKQT